MKEEKARWLGEEEEEESDEDLRARTVDRSSRRMDGLIVFNCNYLFLFLEVILVLSIIWSGLCLHNILL